MMGRRTTVFVRVLAVFSAIFLFRFLIVESKRIKTGRKIDIMLKKTGSAFDLTAAEDYSEIVFDESADEIVTVIHTAEEDASFNDITILDKKIYSVDLDNVMIDRFTDVRVQPVNEMIPFFWQIPHVGSAFQALAVSCLDLILASRFTNVPRGQSLEYTEDTGHTYVSVDLTTKQGINDAVALGLPDSDLPYNLIVTTELSHGAGNLLSQSKGKLFTLMRHPIERAIAVYSSFVLSSKDPKIENMTLEQYATSSYAEENWMVRRLTDNLQYHGKDVNEIDLLTSKEILRQKCVIGLYSKINESIDRFEKMFRWGSVTDNEEKSKKMCYDRIISNVQQRDKDLSLGQLIKKSDNVYTLLLNKNKLDMDLYLYAVKLYDAQKQMFTS